MLKRIIEFLYDLIPAKCSECGEKMKGSEKTYKATAACNGSLCVIHDGDGICIDCLDGKFSDKAFGEDR